MARHDACRDAAICRQLGEKRKWLTHVRYDAIAICDIPRETSVWRRTSAFIAGGREHDRFHSISGHSPMARERL
jgi:hypothetical protein